MARLDKCPICGCGQTIAQTRRSRITLPNSEVVSLTLRVHECLACGESFVDSEDPLMERAEAEIKKRRSQPQRKKCFINSPVVIFLYLSFLSKVNRLSSP